MTSLRHVTASKPIFGSFAVVLLTGVIGLFGFGLAETVSLSIDRIACCIDESDAVPLPYHQEAPPILTATDLYFPGVLAGSSGKRQNDVRAAGETWANRHFSGGHVTRGGFLLLGSIRSYYGEISPHLFFCRLQN